MQETFRNTTNEELSKYLNELAFTFRLNGMENIAMCIDESATRLRDNFFVPEDE